MSVKAIQTVTGSTLTETTGRASSEEEVIDAATRLVRTVRQGLGDRCRIRRDCRRSRACRQRRWMRSSLRDGARSTIRRQIRRSRQSYQKAVELDPKVGLGYQGLGHI